MCRHQLTELPCRAKLGILGIEIRRSESCQIWKPLWWNKPVAANTQPWHLVEKSLLFATLAGKTMRGTKLPLFALGSPCSSGAYFNFYFWDVYSVFNFGFVLSKPVFFYFSFVTSHSFVNGNNLNFNDLCKDYSSVFCSGLVAAKKQQPKNSPHVDAQLLEQLRENFWGPNVHLTTHFFLVRSHVVRDLYLVRVCARLQF